MVLKEIIHHALGKKKNMVSKESEAIANITNKILLQLESKAKPELKSLGIEFSGEDSADYILDSYTINSINQMIKTQEDLINNSRTVGKESKVRHEDIALFVNTIVEIFPDILIKRKMTCANIVAGILCMEGGINGEAFKAIKLFNERSNKTCGLRLAISIILDKKISSISEKRLSFLRKRKLTELEKKLYPSIDVVVNNLCKRTLQTFLEYAEIGMDYFSSNRYISREDDYDLFLTLLKHDALFHSDVDTNNTNTKNKKKLFSSIEERRKAFLMESRSIMESLDNIIHDFTADQLSDCEIEIMSGLLAFSLAMKDMLQPSFLEMRKLIETDGSSESTATFTVIRWAIKQHLGENISMPLCVSDSLQEYFNGPFSNVEKAVMNRTKKILRKKIENFLANKAQIPNNFLIMKNESNQI